MTVVPYVLLIIISHSSALQSVFLGPGGGGGLHCVLLPSFTCHSCAMLGQEGSIVPLGSLQSLLLSLSQTPFRRETFTTNICQ